MLKDYLRDTADKALSSVVARRYTLMVENEPLTLYIDEKNKRIKGAEFMDRKVNLNLTQQTIEEMMNFPTRNINSQKLEGNDDFTKNVAGMIKAQLNLAISKTDKKVLDRFARGGLVAEDERGNFIEAINKPTGLRGVLYGAVKKTNLIISNLVKRIDNFFEKLRNKVANADLTSYQYLNEYQLKEFNKAPPIADLGDLKDFKSENGKLYTMATEFLKENNITSINDTDTADKEIQNTFLTKAFSAGFTDVIDNKKALFAELQRMNQQSAFDEKEQSLKEQIAINIEQSDRQINFHKEQVTTQTSHINQLNETINSLESKIEFLQKTIAAKNELLEDFKIISKDFPQEEKIDLLTVNQEYLNLPNEDQIAFENQHIFYDNIEPAEKTEELNQIEVLKQDNQITQEQKEELVERENYLQDTTAQVVNGENFDDTDHYYERYQQQQLDLIDIPNDNPSEYQEFNYGENSLRDEFFSDKSNSNNRN